MSYMPFIWLYAGATEEDVYAELDNKASDNVNLELMSTPQCAFVAPAYSEELVEILAREMWDEIQGVYEESFDMGMPFSDLRLITSSQVCERPEGFEGQLPVIEFTLHQYYAGHTIEPIMQIVAQKRHLRGLPERVGVSV
jgi:hypothetical protein